MCIVKMHCFLAILQFLMIHCYIKLSETNKIVLKSNYILRIVLSLWKKWQMTKKQIQLYKNKHISFVTVFLFLTVNILVIIVPFFLSLIFHHFDQPIFFRIFLCLSILIFFTTKFIPKIKYNLNCHTNNVHLNILQINLKCVCFFFYSKNDVCVCVCNLFNIYLINSMCENIIYVFDLFLSTFNSYMRFCFSYNLYAKNFLLKPSGTILFCLFELHIKHSTIRIPYKNQYNFLFILFI